MQRVRTNPDSPPLLKLFANAMERYHSGEVRYVKLLDGGIVDNYGLAGFTIARLASDTPYGPLEPEEAVKLRRLLFMVADAGRAPSGTWAQTVEGPSGVYLITAASDTATESGAVGSYSAFQDTMSRLAEIARQLALQAFRRRAPPLRRAAGWNCRDVKIFVGRIAFDQLGPQRAAALNDVETAFKLPADQVDMVDFGRSRRARRPTPHSVRSSVSWPRAAPRASPAAGADDALPVAAAQRGRRRVVR